MSQASELLDNLTDEQIEQYAVDQAVEEHIVIGADRFITVPERLKRLAVQFDHNIETVTFDCPRFWDEHDLSKMKIYINYMRPDKYSDMDLAENVMVDETDDSIMHFTWTITGNVTPVKGNLSFLVCIKKTDADGIEENHWNSELCRDCYISEGMECEQSILDGYPDIITDLLIRMDATEAKTTEEAMIGYLREYLAEGKEMTQMVKNFVIEYLSENPEFSETLDEYVEQYIGTIEKTTDRELLGSVEGGLKINRILGNSVQNGDPTPENPVEIESASGNAELIVRGKNLLRNNMGTCTVEGVTYEEHSDGSVTINGTATGASCYTIDIGNEIPYYERDLIASLEGGNGIVRMAVGFWYENGTAMDAMVTVNNNEQTFQYPPEAYTTRTYLAVSKGVTVNNLTVYPMIRLAEVASKEFDKFHERGASITFPGTYMRAIKARFDYQANYIDKNGIPWITDEIDVERGVYIQRIATKVIDGSEGAYVGTHANGQPYHTHGLVDAMVNTPVMSNRYRSTYWDNANGFVYVANRTMVFTDSRFTSADACASILQAEKPEIMYALAQPIETPIDGIDKVIELHSFDTHKDATCVIPNDDLLRVEVQYGISAVGGLTLENSNRIMRETIGMRDAKYAGSETPGGPANSAVKLANPVKIGKADFDGTASISMARIMGRSLVETSGTNYKGMCSKFATIDLRNVTWGNCMGLISMVDTEQHLSSGILHFYFRVNGSCKHHSSGLSWVSISDWRQHNLVFAVEVSDGLFDLYYTADRDYSTVRFTLIDCISPDHVTMRSWQDYVSVDTLTPICTSSIRNVAGSLYGLTASATELNYMKGVTSGVQGQLDDKINQQNFLDSGTDLNIVTKTGVYRLAQSHPNMPSGFAYSQMFVGHGGSDTIFQMIVNYANPCGIVIRSGNPPEIGGTGTWGTWRTMLNDSKIANNATTTAEGYVADARQIKALSDMIVNGSKAITTATAVTGSSSNFQQYDCGGDELEDSMTKFRSLTINFMKINGSRLAYMYGEFSFWNPGKDVIKVWNSKTDIFPSGFKPAQAAQQDVKQYHSAAHISYNSNSGGATFIIVPAGHYYSFPSLHISAGGNTGDRTVKFFIPYLTT